MKHRVKLIGYGCQVNDHPLVTRLVGHGLDPTQPRLIKEWKRTYGRDPKVGSPLQESSYKNLMVKGHIPGIENVGGQLSEVAGKQYFFTTFP